MEMMCELCSFFPLPSLVFLFLLPLSTLPLFSLFFLLVLVSVCVVGVYAWMGWVCAYIYVKIKKNILKLSAVGV